MWDSMIDVQFFKKKYAIDFMVSQYLSEITKLKSHIKTSNDETKIKIYHQAANTFYKLSAKDIFQFAISHGKGQSAKSVAMSKALPILLGNYITQPSKVDVAYLELLLAYTKAFKVNRAHVKEWTLRFLFNSQYSPLYSLISREIDSLIADTQRKISHYQRQIQQ